MLGQILSAQEDAAQREQRLGVVGHGTNNDQDGWGRCSTKTVDQTGAP